jgi:hypothetical protein
MGQALTSIQGQVAAVRKAAARAALQVRDLKPGNFKRKAETQRDVLLAAAATLSAVEASRAALDRLPDAQRDRLAVALAAGGYVAVMAEEPGTMAGEPRRG